MLSMRPAVRDINLTCLSLYHLQNSASWCDSYLGIRDDVEQLNTNSCILRVML